MSLDVSVRAANRDDAALLRLLILELTSAVDCPRGPRLTAEDLVRDGFSSTPAWYFALIAEDASRAVLGYALCARAYSCLTGRAFHLENLYVRPVARRKGVGRALLRHVAQLGLSEGVTRVDWQVLESNSRALAFYARLGARDLRVSEGRTAMRWDEERMRALLDASDGY